MVSLSAISIPVLLDTNIDPSHSVRQWARLYHYGHIELPFLCVSATLLYAYAARRRYRHSMKGKGRQWSLSVYAAAAVATFAMVPFTWIFMAGTNNRLFQLNDLSMSSEESASDIDIEADMVRGLLVKWAILHVARSGFPLIGAGLGLMGVAREVGVLVD